MIKLADILNELGINSPNITKQTIHDRRQNGDYGTVNINSNPLLKRDLKALGSKNGDLYTFNVKLNPYKKGKYHLESKTTLDLYTDNRTSIKKIKQILDILEIPYNECNVYEGYKVLGYYNYPKFVSIVCYYNKNIIMFSEVSISQNTYWKILTSEKALKLVDIDLNNNKAKNNNKVPYPILKTKIDPNNSQILVEVLVHDGSNGIANSNYNVIGTSILEFTLTKGPYIHYYGDDDPHNLIQFNDVVGNIKIVFNGEIFDIPINYHNNYNDEFYDLDDGRTNFTGALIRIVMMYIDKINLKRNKLIKPKTYSKDDLENILF